MGASRWWQVRWEARRRRVQVLGPDRVTSAEETVTQAAQWCGLRLRARPAKDALLSGTLAVLDTEAQTIWFRSDLQPEERPLVLAHELGHFWLHSATCRCGREDFEDAGAESLVGYGPRERGEAEANLFAREFLLPLPLLRRWFDTDQCPASTIARRAGLARPVVLSQLADTLVAEPPDDLSPPAPPETQAPLDPSQRAAAHAASGPLLVGAGPGTGKTRTLAARVQYLTQERGESPDSLLVLTFGRRAAEELRDRIASEAPDTARRAFISTFHGYGLDLLRRYWQHADLPPRPVLLDEAESLALLERHVARLHLNALWYPHDPAFPLPDILFRIARAKEALATPEALAAQAQAAGQEALAEVARAWAVYETLLREKGALDFADLVARPVRLLQQHPPLLEAERARWRQVLVDEYQDVNPAGARLVRLLAGNDAGGLWVVGDRRQSIYAFRGASPANIGAWETDYPSGTRTELGLNYRSRPPLVALFGAACGEGSAAWRAARAGTATATMAVASDDAAQADNIATRIKRFARDGYVLADQVVLCRTRGQARAIRAALEARGVPVLPGGEEARFFFQPDVKDLLALLQRHVQPEGPARHRMRELPPGLPSGGGAWVFLAEALWGAPGWARRVADRPAVARLLELARAFDERGNVVVGDGEDFRQAFLTHVRRIARLGAASKNREEAANPDAVRVLTVHAAKGLEFGVVFVPNLSRGKFPPQAPPALLPAAEPNGEEDEEARLFFVALTRARDHLVLSRAEKYQNRSAQPSPLLDGLNQVAGLQQEAWTSNAFVLSAISESASTSSENTHLEAWEAELYNRCPRRFRYERVLHLPAGEPSLYAEFKHTVREALRGADTATPLFSEAEAVSDVSHPHASLYRAAAEKIVVRERAARAAYGQRPEPDALAVTLTHGVITVRPDDREGAVCLERHTFRKPPPNGAVPSEARLSLLHEAARQAGGGEEVVVRQRYLRTGDVLPVPDKPKQRAKHLAHYEAALRGVALQMFPASPDDEKSCPACPFFFICPT